MSDNGEDSPEVIEFEELDLEEPTTTKEEQLAAFLKEKLSEEDFGAAAKILGIEGEDLSNAELLEKLVALFKGKEEKPEDEDEEEKEMGDYKTFMKECMAEGKDLKECADEWKKKYPEPKPKEEGEEEAAELAKKKKKEDNDDDEDEDKDMETLKARVSELEGKLHLEKVSNEVSELVHDKHLSPRQATPIIKLSARMTEDMREEFLDVFKSQKFTVSEDKGSLASKRPGATSWEIDEETRARIMKEHGIADLIEDKGVKPRSN